MKGCSVCGTKTAKFFDWHHPGKKNFDMSVAFMHSKKAIHAELKLVEVMCKSHHAKFHMTGKKLSKKTREKMSKAQYRRWENHRKELAKSG